MNYDLEGFADLKYLMILFKWGKVQEEAPSYIVCSRKEVSATGMELAAPYRCFLLG